MKTEKISLKKWESGPISVIADINPKIDLSRLESKSYVSFLPMQNIGDDGELKLETMTYSEVKTGYTTFAEGDILFAKITPCMENGKGALAKGLHNGIGFGSTEFHVLRAKDGINQEYLYHLTRDPNFRKEAERYMTGSAGQKRVPASFFKKFDILIPTYEEQSYIATILSKVDAAIQKSKAAAEKTKCLKRGVLYRLMNDSIGDGSIAFGSLYAEPSKNGLTRPKKVRGKGYKMVNMGELFAHDCISNQKMELVPLSMKEVENYSLRDGDLLFARQSLVTSGVGKCSIIVDPDSITTFESHIIRVRLDLKESCPLYYFYYFASPQGMDNIQSHVTQVAAAGIKGSTLAKIPVPKPPIGRQQYIVKIISTIDRKLGLQHQRTAAFERLKQGLMNDLLNGKHYRGRKNEILRV